MFVHPCQSIGKVSLRRKNVTAPFGFRGGWGSSGKVFLVACEARFWRPPTALSGGASKGRVRFGVRGSGAGLYLWVIIREGAETFETHRHRVAMLRSRKVSTIKD